MWDSSTAARAADAELSSRALRNEIEALFTRFERQHRLPQGYGEKFQLGGYRA